MDTLIAMINDSPTIAQRAILPVLISKSANRYSRQYQHCKLKIFSTPFASLVYASLLRYRNVDYIYVWKNIRMNKSHSFYNSPKIIAMKIVHIKVEIKSIIVKVTETLELHSNENIRK